jgi:uncharacterized protein (TIGR04141 family)
MEVEIGQISVYLAKEKRTFDSVLDQDEDLTRRKNLRIFDFKTDGATCRFIYFETPASKKNPPWLNFVNEKLPDADRIQFQARSLSANGALLVSLNDRVIIATFGRSALTRL